MNQNYINPGDSTSSYGTVQGTYPPYTNFPGYLGTDTIQNNNSVMQPQYTENLFTMNLGKTVTAYLSYPDSIEWRDRRFTGKILASGRDYLLIETADRKKVIILLVYLNYATFDEEISY